MRLKLYRHVLEQRQGAAAIAQLALGSLRQRGERPPTAPGPWLEVTEPPRSRALVHDYLVENGGDPASWGEELPPHLLAQFGLPLAMRVIAGLPYPVQRTLNAGCAWIKHAPLPAQEPLDVRARLETVDDDGSRVKAVVKVVAGTASAPDGLEAEMRVFIPLARRRRPAKAKGGAPLTVATVPSDARALGRVELRADAGAVFAALTGDFNPIHWFAPAAWAAGFRRCILHGFAMHTRAVEALGAALPGGARRVKAVEVRFARPLLLPSEVGVFTRGEDFWLAGGLGAPANLVGSYQKESGR